MKTLTLKQLQDKAKKDLHWKKIEIWELYERVNTNCYLWIKDLWNCIKDIPTRWEKDLLELDKWYLYWDWDLLEYLTAILSTYIENYIREHITKRNSFILED